MSCFVAPSGAVLRWSHPEAWNGVGKGWGGSSGSIPGPGEDVIILPSTWGRKGVSFLWRCWALPKLGFIFVFQYGLLALVAIPVCAGPHICCLSHRLQYKNVVFGRKWEFSIFLYTWTQALTYTDFQAEVCTGPLFQKRICKTQNHKEIISWPISICVLSKDHIFHFCNCITFHFIFLLQFQPFSGSLSN